MDSYYRASCRTEDDAISAHRRVSGLFDSVAGATSIAWKRSGVDVSRAGARAFCAALVIAVAACGPDKELASIARALELTVTEASRGPTGDSIDVVFKLTNRGETEINACFGPSRSVSYETSRSGGSSFRGVEHPGCMREFTLQPTKDMTWSEALRMPRLSEPRVEVQIGVEIVNPRRCGRVGCPAIELKSNPYTID